MNPVMGAAVAFVDGKNLAVKPITPKLKAAAAKTSSAKDVSQESPDGKPPQNVASGNRK